MNRSRRRLRSIVRYLVLPLVLLLTVSDLLLRFVWGFGTPPLLVKDSASGYFYKADQKVWRFGHLIKINHFHQRSDDVAPTPSHSTLRLLFVGDSVTFGGALLDQKQIYTELVKDRLRQTLKQPVEVLNASTGAWNPGNEWGYMETQGTFGSKIVVLQIGSHDLLKGKTPSDFVGTDPDMPDHAPACALSELLFRYLIPRIQGYEHPAAADTPPYAGPPTDVEKSFEGNMRCVFNEVDMARKSGANVSVIHTADRNEVTPVDGQPLVEAYAPWRARFLVLCEKQNVPVLNLAEQWKGKPEAATYYRDVVHLTAAGNREVADAYLNFFEEQRRKDSALAK